MLLYRALYRIRRVEEKIIELYPSDKIKSPVHLSIGQEAVSVGVCAALAREDIAFGTYRGHALYLAKGGDLKRMLAELYGKADGAARGKAGSMHLIDVAAGMMGTSAIVATTIPQAVGYAFALKSKQEPCRRCRVLRRRSDGRRRLVREHEFRGVAAAADPVRVREQFLCDLFAYPRSHAGSEPVRAGIRVPHPDRADRGWRRAAHP